MPTKNARHKINIQSFQNDLKMVIKNLTINQHSFCKQWLLFNKENSRNQETKRMEVKKT